MERKYILALVAGALIAAILGLALAATIYGETSGTTTWNASDGPEITAVDVNLTTDVPVTENSVDFGHTNFTSNGPTSAWARDFHQDFINVTNISADANNLTIESDSRPTVVLDGNANEVKWRNYSTNDGNTDLVVDPGNNALSIELHDLPTDSYVSINDSNGNVVAVEYVDDTGSQWFEIGSSGDYKLESLDAQDVFSDEYPNDGQTMTKQKDIPLNVTVDPPRSGEHSITFYNADDDSVIGTDTVQDSGEAETVWSTPDLGTRHWYASINNSANSSDYEFSTPANVEIRDEETLELINDSVKVTVKFFWNNSQVFEKTTTSGLVNLSSLPPDEPLVISAAENNSEYYDRRIILPTITEQGTIYLLNKSTSAVETEFQLEDKTGEFDSPGTRLFIQRPITENGSTDYLQLAGDRFGASNAFTQFLQEGVRYQLRIKTENNQTRELGHYQADRDQTVELTVGELDWDLGNDIDDVTYEMERFEVNDSEYIRFQLNDTAEITENLKVTIFETGNKSNRTIYQDTLAGPFGEAVVTTPIPASAENVTSWSVNFSADRGGETIGATEVIGSGTYPVDTGDNGMIAIFSALLLTFVAGMFSIRVATLGIVIVPIVALGLFAMGWLPLPVSWILAALTLGVAAEFASRGGFSYR